MPGLSFVSLWGRSITDQRDRILQSLASMTYTSSYKRHVLLDGPSYILASTKYDEYPTYTLDSHTYYVYVEGMIRPGSSSSTNDDLLHVAALLFDEKPETRETIAQWLLKTDGEFVLFVKHKVTGEVAILNDALAHLPLYYGKTGDMCVVSREVRLVAGLIDGSDFDSVALAQYLLLCYPLGGRTLFRGVSRLSPATIVRIGSKTPRFSVDVCHRYNFEHTPYQERSLAENADNLVEILLADCKQVDRSTSGLPNVVGLSGGMDSRLVAALLMKTGTPFSATSRLDATSWSRSDVGAAERLARTLDLDWRIIHPRAAKFRDARELLRMKGGLNYLAMSFILPYFAELRETYGHRATYWTGDTGIPLKSMMPKIPIRSSEDLIRYILRVHSVVGLEDSSRLLQIEPIKVLEHVQDLLDTYPERDLAHKYVHFIVDGRAMRWLWEGIDRNRYFFWTATPLSSTVFFSYAMKCPSSQKAKLGLYQSLFARTVPDSWGVKYAQYGVAPSSVWFPFVTRTRGVAHWLPSGLREALKKVLRQSARQPRPNRTLVECIEHHFENCTELGKYISVPSVRDYLRRCTGIQAKTLFTVMAVIEDSVCSGRSWDPYLDSDFM